MKRIGGMLLLSFSINMASQANTGDISLMTAQTEHPSVGHRPYQPDIDYVLASDDGGKIISSTSRGYYLPLLPGMFISADSNTAARDPDNKFLAADDQETVINFRSVFRIDDSGNSSPVPGEQEIEVDNFARPYYRVAADDLNHRLKFVFKRKTHAGHIMVPDESLVQEIETDKVITSFQGTVIPVLNVNGVDRPDFTIFRGETGHLRFTLPPEINNILITSGAKDSPPNGVTVSELKKENNEYLYQIQIADSFRGTTKYEIRTPFYLSSTIGGLWSKSVFIEIKS